jgi:hypothetical protein
MQEIEFVKSEHQLFVVFEFIKEVEVKIILQQRVALFPEVVIRDLS